MAHRSGYNASLSIGTGYTGAELTNVAVTVNHEPIEVSDLASTWKERVAGLKSWEVTGSKNFATQAFLTLAASGNTSVAVAVKDQDGTTIFSGAGFVTRGLSTFPQGAATEEVTIQGKVTYSGATEKGPVHAD
jgi:predicted secreted protein